MADKKANNSIKFRKKVSFINLTRKFPHKHPPKIIRIKYIIKSKDSIFGKAIIKIKYWKSAKKK